MSETELDTTPAATRATPTVLVVGPLVLVAAALSLWVRPFEPGYRFGIAGSAPTIVRAALFWLAAGFGMGVVLSRRSVVGAGYRTVRAAIGNDRDRLRHAALGLVVGSLVAVAVRPALAATLGILTAILLAPGLVRATADAVVATVHRVAGTRGEGLAFGPPAAVTVLAAFAIASVVVAGTITAVAALFFVGGVVLFLTTLRARAEPPAAALVILAALMIGAIGAIGVGTAAAQTATTKPVVPKTVKNKQVSVPADKGFASTGLTVAAGQVLTISAKGSVTFLASDKKARVNPDGFPARYSGCGGPGLCGVLVGRVAKGAPFLVGSAYSAPMTVSGPLDLGINDYDVDDNGGSFKAVVSVQPPTAITTAGTAAGAPVVLPDTSGPAAPSNGRAAGLAGLLAGIGAFAGSRRSARVLASA